MSKRAVLTGLAVVAAMKVVAIAVGGILLFRHRNQWPGSSAAERRARLPGDELISDARVQNDRAITIDAPPERVWPWVAQLGQEKAGFYSFEVLENAIGCEIHGATRIHPEWQDVGVGDSFKLHPDVEMRVAHVEPGTALVISSQGGTARSDIPLDMTWAFRVSAAATTDGTASWASRLHVRERYGLQPESTDMSPAAAVRMIDAVSMVSAIMSWRMLHRISRLATSVGAG